MIKAVVTDWLAKDMQPTYSIEKPGFRKMLKALNPRYELPSRSHFSRTAIPSLYTELRESVKATLASDQITLERTSKVDVEAMREWGLEAERNS